MRGRCNRQFAFLRNIRPFIILLRKCWSEVPENLRKAGGIQDSRARGGGELIGQLHTLATGGAGWTGKSGRKTANPCGKSAKDMSMDSAAHFMFVAENTSKKVYHRCAVALPTFSVRYRRLVRPLVVVVSF